MLGAYFIESGGNLGSAGFSAFASLDGETFVPVESLPVQPDIPGAKHGNVVWFFDLYRPIETRYVAYFFDRCDGNDCYAIGSRIFEVYAMSSITR